MFKLLLVLFLSLSIYAKDIKPSLKFHCVGYVSDFVIDNNFLYASTDKGTIDIFDLKTQKIIHQVNLPPSYSFDGEKVPTQIFSIDVRNGKLLFVSYGQNGYRNVWTYENYELKQINNIKNKMLIKEAKFIGKDKILLATYDSDIVLYDETEGFEIYHKHVSHSALKDITLSQDRSKVIMSDESGEIKVIDINNGAVLQELKSENVDDVYHVASRNGTIVTGGKDRRVGVYQKGKEAYHLKSNFFVYCVGISPSAKVGVYSSGYDNDLQLFNISTKQKLDKLVGHKKLINQIKFISEKEIFSSSRDYDIFYWKLD